MKRISLETFVFVAFTIVGILLVSISLIEFVRCSHSIVGDICAFIMGLVFIVVGAIIRFSDK